MMSHILRPFPATACPVKRLAQTAGGYAQRRGTSLVLILAMLSTFVITAAITIDYAYMCLVQTELRVATDAAAKAGVEALFRLDGVDAAKAAAVNYAALNTVGGSSLQIREQDVTVGRLTWAADGNWTFAANSSHPNAVRVNSRTGGTSLHPAIPLFFGRVLGRNNFTPGCTATAAQEDIAICLCIDRSGSMLYDMSGLANSYAAGNPNLSNYREGGLLYRYSVSPPHPTASRWAVLGGALDLYFEEVSQYTPPPRTGLVTWAAEAQLGPPDYTSFAATTLNVAIPAHGQGNWNSNLTHINNAMRQLGRAPIAGETNLSAGLDMAVEALSAPETGEFATKVVILFTDGRWNAGRHPREAAADARAAGVIVHTITMLTEFQEDVKEVSRITGGRHFMTNNEAELRHAFRELARSFQVVLVE